ncbi:hypothetical protein Tco_0630343 [Tanacetum coccineum]
MFEVLKYVQSLEKGFEELESKKAEFSNEYDLLLQECDSKDIMCAIIHSFDNLHQYSEMACNYLEAIAKFECLENELSKRNENVENKSFNELEKHFISLKLSLQQRNESFQNNRPCNNHDAPEFPQFFEINE